MIVDPPVRETILDNGIRVVTEQVPHLYSVALGLRVDAGARDEADEETGVSHLLEHMLFKGTERRSARQIAEELDAVGGQMDAFTSREYTGFSARVLPEHVPLALDVLADMLRHSRLDEAELELEKSVILEEFRSLEDAPEEYVHDLFSRTLWPRHPLGRPVIGSPDVVARLTRADLLRFLTSHYVPPRLVCVAAGRLDHDAFVREIERQFGDLTGHAPERRLVPPEATAERCLLHRPTEQTHFCLGSAGVDENDPDRWPLRMLNLVLGGGMSSRLFQEVREKRGLCYSIGSDTASYREGGMITVYADTSPEHLEAVCELAREEMLRMARHGLTAEELARAKQQVRASLLLSLDDVVTRMNRLARSLLYHGRIVPPSELMASVDAVTQEDCLRVAERCFGSGAFAFAAIGPLDGRRGR